VHTGRDRPDRASQPAPCRRERPGVRAEPSSRTGIPLLRLPDGSKGGEVLEFAVAHHVDLLSTTRPGGQGRGSGAEAGDSVGRETASGERPWAPGWPSAERLARCRLNLRQPRHRSPPRSFRSPIAGTQGSGSRSVAVQLRHPQLAMLSEPEGQQVVTLRSQTSSTETRIAGAQGG
jgi:hypothetical protein